MLFVTICPGDSVECSVVFLLFVYCPALNLKQKIQEESMECSFVCLNQMSRKCMHCSVVCLELDIQGKSVDCSVICLRQMP